MTVSLEDIAYAFLSAHAPSLHKIKGRLLKETGIKPSKRGPHRYDFVERDLIIAEAVALLVGEGLTPMRSLTKKPGAPEVSSACRSWPRHSKGSMRRTKA